MKNLIAAALLCASASSAYAAMLAFPNVASCGRWLQIRAAAESEAETAGIFMLGYLGGWQAGAGLSEPPFIDAPTYYAWLDKNCRDDPLRNPIEITATFMKAKSKARK